MYMTYSYFYDFVSRILRYMLLYGLKIFGAFECVIWIHMGRLGLLGEGFDITCCINYEF